MVLVLDCPDTARRKSRTEKIETAHDLIMESHSCWTVEPECGVLKETLRMSEWDMGEPLTEEGEL